MMMMMMMMMMTMTGDDGDDDDGDDDGDDDDDGDVPFQSRPFSIHVTMRPCVHAFPSSPATARRLTSPWAVSASLISKR